MSSVNDTPRIREVVLQNPAPKASPARAPAVRRHRRAARRQTGQRDISGSSRPRQSSSAARSASSSEHRRDDNDFNIRVGREDRHAAQCEPDRRRKQHLEHLRRFVRQRRAHRSRSGRSRARMSALAMSLVTKSGAAPREVKRPRPHGIDDMGRAPPHRGADAAVLQAGKDQQCSEKRRDEHRHHGERLDIEMHEPPPMIDGGEIRQQAFRRCYDGAKRVNTVAAG